MNVSDTKSNRTTDSLKGLFPPLLLPLDESGGLDFDSLRRQIDFLLAGGIDGLWVNGTTGDFFALTDDENEAIVEAVVEHVQGRVPVVAQVGDAATRRAVAKANRAMRAGADFISVVLPYYLEYSQAELQEHYRVISRASGQPVVLYQLPQMCKVTLTVENILELVREGVLVGIKDSSGDMDFYGRLTTQVAKERLSLRCFVGSGALMTASLRAGGHGLMCAIANLVPHLCKGVYQASLDSEWEQATALQNQVQELIDVMRLPDRSNWAATVAVYKWMLRQLGVIETERVFAPLQPLSEREQALLRTGALPLLTRHAADLLEKPSAPHRGR
jgi:4-hydroxy-tetrahydrodipicolinate synthase